MKYVEGKLEEVETYRGYKIIIEHNLNIYEQTKEEQHPIYTICKMGRCFQGAIEEVRKFIDNMFLEYGEEESNDNN